jgi:hypothetical protein
LIELDLGEETYRYIDSVCVRIYGLFGRGNGRDRLFGRDNGRDRLFGRDNGRDRLFLRPEIRSLKRNL